MTLGYEDAFALSSRPVAGSSHRAGPIQIFARQTYVSNSRILQNAKQQSKIDSYSTTSKKRPDFHGSIEAGGFAIIAELTAALLPRTKPSSVGGFEVGGDLDIRNLRSLLCFFKARRCGRWGVCGSSGG